MTDPDDVTDWARATALCPQCKMSVGVGDTVWRGHPWGHTDDHRPVGSGQAICAGCDERCSEQVGCMCCRELAYEWLLEEARQWAMFLDGTRSSRTQAMAARPSSPIVSLRTTGDTAVYLLAERTWQRDQARDLCTDLLSIYAPELGRIDWDTQTLTVSPQLLDEMGG